MKILHIITNIKNCGPFRVLESIIDLDNKQNKYAIASLFGDDDSEIIQKLEEKNIEVINLNLNKVSLLINKKKQLKLIDSKSYDVIHSHGILPDYFASHLKNTKIITTIHNNMYEDYIFNFGNILGKIYCKWHEKIMKKFNKVVCCSKSIYDVLIAKLNYDNLCFIRNGIDVIDYKNFKDKRIAIRNEFNISSEDNLYVYAGVISQGKAVVELTKLFDENAGSNDYLFIIGEGPMLEQCMSNDNIKLLGYKNNIYDYFAAADVYISNSKSEGFSISVLEAVMMNNLLLLSDIPSHKEVIEMCDEYIGEIFNENDFKEHMDLLEIHKNMNISDKYFQIISNSRMRKEYYSKYKEIIYRESRSKNVEK